MGTPKPFDAKHRDHKRTLAMKRVKIAWISQSAERHAKMLLIEGDRHGAVALFLFSMSHATGQDRARLFAAAHEAGPQSERQTATGPT